MALILKYAPRHVGIMTVKDLLEELETIPIEATIEIEPEGARGEYSKLLINYAPPPKGKK